MAELYQGVNSSLTTLKDDTPPFDSSFYDAVVEELYGLGGYTPEYLTSDNGAALIDETYNILSGAVNVGLTEEVDPNFREALDNNVFIFSGFKTHQELEEVNALLRDENGNIKPFNQFKLDVLNVSEKYNVNYLQAEYNMAVQSAQMASKWQDFEAHKNFVNLQYRTAGDDRVRAEHQALDGTTLPVEDAFWKEYLPPLGWNCRCTVVEVLKDSVPVSNSKQAIKAGEMATSKPSQKIFRFNPGITKKVFPPKHPYFPKSAECKTCKLGKGIGLVKGKKVKNCKKEVCQSLKELQDKKADPTKQQPRVVAYQEGKDIKQIEKDRNYKPYEPNIYTPVYKDGQDPNEPDFDDKIAFAREAVKKGYRVWLLNKTKVQGVKNPDLLLERKGIYHLYDHKRIRSIKSLIAELDDSSTQAPRVVIKNTDNNDNPRTIILAISKYYKNHPQVREVIISQGKRMISIDRAFCDRPENKIINSFIRLWK